MGLDLVRYAICLEYSWTSESLEGYSLKYKPQIWLKVNRFIMAILKTLS